MNPVVEKVAEWRREGKAVAVGTVVGIERSAPLGPGAMMAVNESGEVAGSVSGGCVEGAVFDEAVGAMGDGRPRLLTYGIADDEAFGIGLTCGGTIHIFVDRVDAAEAPILEELRAALDEERPVALATIIEGPPEVLGTKMLVGREDGTGTTGNEHLDRAVAEAARGMLELGQTGTRRCGPRGQRRMEDVAVFVQSFAPPPRMYVFGAIDYAAATARIGKLLGYRVTVCDARAVFATRERFPMADEVIVMWPHRFLKGAEVDRRTVICVLTHDPKFDVPVLLEALKTEAGYIGAMGSRRTVENRNARLREAGATEEELRRISGPIGLDIGARTPEETAVAIAAEIVALRTGHPGGRLGERTGPIHHEAPRTQPVAGDAAETG
jgi:xanthine dehydrogenase accessory factor